MTDFLLMLGLLAPVIILYVFVLGLAKKDLAERQQAMLPTYAILLIPLVGPLFYLVFRAFRK
jgi:Na+/proline symporter